jgi:hypothetical protein
MAGVEDGEFDDADIHDIFMFLNSANLRSINLKIDQSGSIPSSWILLDN